jgi:hypothetical protein
MCGACSSLVGGSTRPICSTVSGNWRLFPSWAETDFRSNRREGVFV